MIFFLCGFLLGSFFVYLAFRLKKKRYWQLGSEILHRAELESEKKESALALKLKEREFQEEKRLRELEENCFRKLDKEKEKLRKKEEKLEASWTLFVKKMADVEKKKEWLIEKERENQEEREKIASQIQALNEKLSQTAKLLPEEAKKLLFANLERELEAEISGYITKKRLELESDAQIEAQRVLALTLGRLSLKASHETALSQVSLPSDEMKGRIIGREGKNIRTFEEKTGVNLIIDETPKTVIISSYDPYRRAVAHLALVELISDGRIHPSHIEEVVVASQEKVLRKIKEEGERAVKRVQIIPPSSEIIRLLGALSLRYSLGQNVLEHSIEVACIMGLMAQELNLDAELAKRIGLLHDIGKAVSHEEEGSHALIGLEMALKHGESQDVANGIGSHHGEIAAETIEGLLASSADTLSGARMGARSEGAEYLFKRMQKLEALASSFEGVEKAYAFSSGKELRIIAEPKLISDEELTILARKIAKQIEEEITFSGKIKVTVIRERKATEYAI